MAPPLSPPPPPPPPPLFIYKPSENRTGCRKVEEVIVLVSALQSIAVVVGVK